MKKISKLEFIFPLIASIRINKIIDKEKIESYEQNYSKWNKILKNNSISETQIENIAYNIYADEDKRTSNIENKGSWLLIGVGIAISLLSIIMGFSFEANLSILQVAAIGFFLWSISNLMLSGIGAHKAMKIGRKYVLVADDFSKTLTDGNDPKILDWAAKYLAAVESNLTIIRQKSNLIDVSQQHFVRGLIFTTIGFILLSWQIASTILNSEIYFEGLDFLANFTNP